MTTRSLLALSLCALAACTEGAPAVDGGKPQPSFDPTPAGATRIDLGAPLSTARVLLASIDYANFERRGGELFLFAQGGVFEFQRVCTGDGCLDSWAIVPTTFCWKVDGTTATKSTGCQQVSDLRGEVPRPQERGELYSALRTFSGSRRPTSTLAGGLLLSGTTESGTYELLGGATLEVPAAEEFGSWVAPTVMRKSPVHYRMSVRDGGLVAPPLLQRSPDEVSLLDGMMAFLDEGALELTWRNRDDTVFAIDPATPALSGTLLGNGVFGLGWNAPFFPEGSHTGGAAVLNDEWLGLFVIPSYESTDDHGVAAGGGPLHNLYLRRAKLEGAAPQPLTHFTGLEATTASSTTVDVCFNRRIDPSTVATASITVDGLEVKSWELLPAGQCLVARTSAQDRSQSYAVHVAGLRSVDGEALTAQRLSFLPDESAVTDLLEGFTGVKPGPPDVNDIAVLLPMKTGAVMIHPGGLQPFQEGGGYFMTGTDARTLFNLSARYAAQGLSIPVNGVLPSPAPGEVWFRFAQSSPGLAFLDGSREQVFTPLTHPGVTFEIARVLGDGTAAVKQNDGTWVRLMKDGTTQQPFLGPPPTLRPRDIIGVVWGSEGVLVEGGAPLLADRLAADGGVLSTWDFTGKSTFLPTGMVVFELGAETLICAPEAGLFRVEPSPQGLTKLIDACTHGVIAPDGTLWLRSTYFPGSSSMPTAWRYANGLLAPHVVADPIYGLAVGGSLEAPVRVGDSVFAWTGGVGGGFLGYPSTLRLMTADDFAALPVEVIP